MAAYSVDHMFSLYFDYLNFFIISRFGFEGLIWVLIDSGTGFAYFLLLVKSIFLDSGATVQPYIQ